ncbi:hypothetical protein NRK67_03175 [Fusobacteria bacterium ZRK30]|nr:hypothetical protein NRK67_03175 [Fusobacteria bacterium ZRK30]
MKKIIFIFFILFLTSFSSPRDNLNFMSTFKERYEVKKKVEFYKDRMNKIEKSRELALTEEEIKNLDKRYVQAQEEIKLGEMTINKIDKRSGFMAKSVVYPLMDAWIDIYDVTDKEDITSRNTIVRNLLLLILTFIIIMRFILKKI